MMEHDGVTWQVVIGHFQWWNPQNQEWVWWVPGPGAQPPPTWSHDGVNWQVVSGQIQWWNPQNQEWVWWVPGPGAQPPPSWFQHQSGLERFSNRITRTDHALDAAGKIVKGIVVSLIIIGIVVFLGSLLGSW